MESSPIAPEFDPHPPATPISSELETPTVDGTQSGESELVQQLRADLEMQRLIAENAMRDCEDARRMAEMRQGAEDEHQSLWQRYKQATAELQYERDERQKQRHQAEVSREQTKAYVDSLQEKLRSSREERKSWLVEAVELRSEVSELRKALAAQGKLLAQESTKAFKLAAQRLEESPKFERVANFERRIDQLMSAQKLWADDIRKLNELQEFVDLKENEFQRLGQVLRGRIHEIELLSGAIRDYELEIAQVRGKLAAAERAASSKALSPMALEYAAEVRAEMAAMELQMEHLAIQNDELLRQNAEQAEMLYDLREQLSHSAQNASTPLSATDSLRLPPTRGSASTGSSRSRRESEGAESHAPHLSLQLSPAAAVPPVLSTPMLGGIVGPAFPSLSMQDDGAAE